jgi:ribonuclease T1
MRKKGGTALRRSRWQGWVDSVVGKVIDGVMDGLREGLKPSLSMRAALGVALAASLGLVLGLTLSTAAVARNTQDVISIRALPPEAQRVLVLIQQGGPFPHAKDGVTFFNRERLLPSQARGYYTEYTVPTPGARTRGARRIVAGRGPGGNPATSGEYWYTSDHYSSFQRIQE